MPKAFALKLCVGWLTAHSLRRARSTISQPYILQPMCFTYTYIRPLWLDHAKRLQTHTCPQACAHGKWLQPATAKQMNIHLCPPGLCAWQMATASNSQTNEYTPLYHGYSGSDESFIFLEHCLCMKVSIFWMGRGMVEWSAVFAQLKIRNGLFCTGYIVRPQRPQCHHI